jgi:hypothetical protein
MSHIVHPALYNIRLSLNMSRANLRLMWLFSTLKHKVIDSITKPEKTVSFQILLCSLDAINISYFSKQFTYHCYITYSSPQPFS